MALRLTVPLPDAARGGGAGVGAGSAQGSGRRGGSRSGGRRGWRFTAGRGQVDEEGSFRLAVFEGDALLEVIEALLGRDDAVRFVDRDIDGDRQLRERTALRAADQEHLGTLGVVTQLDRGQALLHAQLALDGLHLVGLDHDVSLERFVALAAIEVHEVIAG